MKVESNQWNFTSQQQEICWSWAHFCLSSLQIPIYKAKIGDGSVCNHTSGVLGGELGAHVTSAQVVSQGSQSVSRQLKKIPYKKLVLRKSLVQLAFWSQLQERFRGAILSHLIDCYQIELSWVHLSNEPLVLAKTWHPPFWSWKIMKFQLPNI